MGCCTSHAEVFRATIDVGPGITCEQARDFLTKGSSWKDIQNKPEGAVVGQPGSWDLQFDGTPDGDVFTVYGAKLETDASGNLVLSYRGTLKISPGILDFGQTYTFTPGENGITIDRHVYDLQISGCVSCFGCCFASMMPASLEGENKSIERLLNELATADVAEARE
jgi:hypothetical protein